MKRTDLKEVISSATLAKLGKNETVNTEVIDKICVFLKCQPNDIMDCVTKEQLEEAEAKLTEAQSSVISILDSFGVTMEDYIKFAQDNLEEYMKKAYAVTRGEIDIDKAFNDEEEPRS